MSPVVDGKHFSYDKKGMAQAEAAAEKSGMPMKMGKNMPMKMARKKARPTRKRK